MIWGALFRLMNGHLILFMNARMDDMKTIMMYERMILLMSILFIL